MDDHTLRKLLDNANAMGVSRGRLEGLLDISAFIATRVEQSGGCKPNELVPYLKHKIQVNNAEHEKLVAQSRELAGLS